MKIVTWLAALVVAGGAIAWAFYYTQDTNAAPAGGPPRIAPMVQVQVVERGDLEKVVRYSATVEPVESIVILPKLSGHLAKFSVDLGDEVSKGEVIAEIDDAEFQQRELQAAANLEFAKARLDRAKIDLQSAERELKRTKDARTGGITTEQDLDAAESDVATARADIEVARAEVTRAEAAHNETAINLENTIIRAPIDGYVDKRRVDAGALVSPNTPLCTIVRLDPAKIVVNIPEPSIQLARVGTETNIEIGNVFTIRLKGKVTRVAPTVDLATRTVEVEISIPNSDKRLRPGMSADVSFIAGRATDAIIVPEQALIRGDEAITVNVVEGGVAKRREVEIGVSANGMAEVRKGLDEGEIIVVQGNFMVEDGRPVRYPGLPGAPGEDS